MAGFGAGLLVFLLSRPVDPQVGSTVAMLALVGSAIVLTIAALVAEQFCTLPKDPDDSEPRDRAPEPAEGTDLAALDQGTYSELRTARNEARLELDGAVHQISPRYVVSQIVQNVIFPRDRRRRGARAQASCCTSSGCGSPPASSSSSR